MKSEINPMASREVYSHPIMLSLVRICEEHAFGFTLDHSGNGDDYLFEFFDSPIVLQDCNGRHSYNGNVFILYAPGQRQYFRAEGSLKHTWFQASGPGVAEQIERYKIPLNRAVSIERPDFLIPLLEEAQRRLVRKHHHWEDSVTEIGRRFFRLLSRSLYQESIAESSPIQRNLLSTLLRVKRAVYKDPRRQWTVDNMADLANMNAPQFSLAFSANFGSGPIDDLIDFRLRYAVALLRHLPISVKYAALCSGFNTASHFHVLFRKRLGRSPKETAHQLNVRPMTFDADAKDPFEGWDAGQKIDLLYFRPVGHWSFDQSGNELIDDLRKHPPATLHNKVEKMPGRIAGNALHFSAYGYAVIPEAVIDTSLSYTVSAWLLHESPGRMTAISICDANHGGFYLQYISDDGGFKFAVSLSEWNPLCVAIVSSEITHDNEWYHVAGVHDSARQEIRLYLDGRLQSIAPYRTPWRVEGSTYFGCCHVVDTLMDYWNGAMDDIRIYDDALSEAEIETLYRDRTDSTALGDEDN